MGSQVSKAGQTRSFRAMNIEKAVYYIYTCELDTDKGRELVGKANEGISQEALNLWIHLYRMSMNLVL